MKDKGGSNFSYFDTLPFPGGEVTKIAQVLFIFLFLFFYFFIFIYEQPGGEVTKIAQV